MRIQIREDNGWTHTGKKAVKTKAETRAMYQKTNKHRGCQQPLEASGLGQALASCLWRIHAQLTPGL